MEQVNLREKLALFDEQWTPKIVAEVGVMHVKLAKIEGEFAWHAHENEDELFMVISGELSMELRPSRRASNVDPIESLRGEF